MGERLKPLCIEETSYLLPTEKMNNEQLNAMRQEIAQCDEDEQKTFIEEFEANPPETQEDAHRLMWMVKERYRDRYLGIIKKYNESSAMRIQYPSLHQ